MKRKHYRRYIVVSGSPHTYSTYVEADDLKDARQKKKEMLASNPHQGGGYHILKTVTTETTTVVK